MIKKFTFLISAIILIQINSNAQISISAVRATTTGTSVTVWGVTTCGPELGRSRYIQQGTTGGINIYFTAAQLTAHPVNRGDSIHVTGIVSSYANNLEIDVTSYSVISSGNPIAPPIVFNASNYTSAYAEQYEGMLVKLTGLTSLTNTASAVVSTLAVNTAYYLNGNSGLIIFPNTASNNATVGVTDGISGKAAPSGNYDIIGIMTQFYAKYELIPRLYADFVQPNIALTSGISITNISQSSLTLNFLTNLSGNTSVNYGTTTTLGSAVSDVNPTINHSINITGLSPATIYYIQVTSTNSGGSVSSLITPVITASNSSGKIQPYFVSKVDNSYAKPASNKAVWLNQTVDDTLIAYINRAKYSLDIAIYNWNNAGLSDISAAVNNAFNRGVNVRIVYDGSTANLALNSLNGAINKVASPLGTSPAGGYYTIMHNKFVVIDALSANATDPYVWTGSTNWTNDQMTVDRNNVVIIQDQSVAKVYTIEFEEMWGSSTLIPGNGKFGNNKRDNTPHQFLVGGKNLEVYFSPTDGTSSKITNAINSANSSFQFAQLIVTRSDISNTVKSKALALGANTSCPISIGLLDDTTSATTAYYTMQGGLKTQLRIKPATATDSLLHHKYLIVDSELPSSDPLVLTGSHNWSNDGENYNDENTLVIHDSTTANLFYQEFAKIYSVFTGGSTCRTSAITGLEKQQLNSSQFFIYPNPAKNELNIRLADFDGSISVDITDLSGKLVLNSKVENGASVNLISIPVGIYVVKLTAGTETKFEKLLVE